MISLKPFPSILIAALSGAAVVLALPGYDIPFLGWVAFAPFFALLLSAPDRRILPLTLAFSLVYSLGAHSWYVDIFPPVLGAFLIVAVGFWFATVFKFALWLSRGMPGPVRIFGLPIAWVAVEFVKFVAPVARDWWFVSPAVTQWRFPAALQVLGVTGFPGLSFLVLLVNLALGALILRVARIAPRPELEISAGSAILALAASALVVGMGAVTMPRPTVTFPVGVITDLSFQDTQVLALNAERRTIADSPATSARTIDTDAALTESLSEQHPVFIVWPENKLALVSDHAALNRISALAVQQGTYITANLVEETPAGRLNVAGLFAPDGQIVLQRAKINLFASEGDAGFVSGPDSFSTVSTPFGVVGVAVCWDVHRLWILRNLARAGARIVLVPMDNDFHANPAFPPHHAADVVFRAVENRLTIAAGSTNGASIVVDPAGRITAQGAINIAGALTGETFTTPATTLYSRFGDWFGWLVVVLALGISALSLNRHWRSPI